VTLGVHELVYHDIRLEKTDIREEIDEQDIEDEELDEEELDEEELQNQDSAVNEQ